MAQFQTPIDSNGTTWGNEVCLGRQQRGKAVLMQQLPAIVLCNRTSMHVSTVPAVLVAACHHACHAPVMRSDAHLTAGTHWEAASAAVRISLLGWLCQTL